MYILGLNAYHGDASACIFKDGNLIAASEEERFCRIKHWAGLPAKSIEFCLAEAGITMEQVDVITLSRDPKANMLKKVKFAIQNIPHFKILIDRLKNRSKLQSLKDEIAQALNISTSEIKAEFVYVEHHRSHLASAFFASPFQEAALLSIDGFGDFSSTMFGVGKGNKINVLSEVNYPHSLGIFYTAFTQFLGFPNYGDEYKIMGLAPYGKPNYVNQLRTVLLFEKNGLFKLNMNYFKHGKEGVNMSWLEGSPQIDNLYSNYFIQKFGHARTSSEELSTYHKDLAASVQVIAEELLIHILNYLHKHTRLDQLCIAGGVAQNSVANGKILTHTNFKKLYIPPAAHDAGTSIGSALYYYNHLLGKERLNPMKQGYFGSHFSVEEIWRLLDKKNIHYQVKDDDELFNEVTDCIVNGGVVGWFQGRAEFGPRALGHRSILADPRRADAKDILNHKIKRRESFRPFAPSILKEFSGDYFEQSDEVPFMEKVFLIKKEKRKLIPAVTHIDGTGRLQTVDRDIEPKYYQLIHRFYEKTGIPILLNTSFNENEPIVNTPEEALSCYLRTQMDMLVLNNCIVRRDKK